MPVFARAKLMIEDDCLTPGVTWLTLNYTGPNPQLLYRKTKELILTIWRSDLNELQEKDFAWDRSGGGEKFNVRFELTKDLDTWSYLRIVVDLNGEARPSKEFGKEGTATVRIDPRLKTEYPQDTIWQRSLFYDMFRTFYHKIIYGDLRKKYKEQCRHDSMVLQERLKEFLNLIPKV